MLGLKLIHVSKKGAPDGVIQNGGQQFEKSRSISSIDKYAKIA